LIFRAFRDAYDSLNRRMHEVALSNEPKSILQSIIAANYDEYIEQRFQLRYVYENSEQFAQYRSPSAERPADRPHRKPRAPRRK